MKLIIENQFGRYKIDEKGDQNIYEMMDLFERLLISMSFDPDTVKNGFLGKAEGYE